MQPTVLSQAAPDRAIGAAAARRSTAVPLPAPRIRRLGQNDRAALTQHFLALPLPDRCTRFGGPSSNEAIRRHVDTLDMTETLCFAALGGDEDVVGAALGFIYTSRDASQSVEVAVSVAPAHRKQGLGAELAARVMSEAASSGAVSAVFEFHPRNAAIHGLIRRVGGHIDPHAETCVISLAALPAH